MPSPYTPGIAPGRLPEAAYAANFGDLEPAFDRHEAHVAADRCYFCHDAPCVTACPTAIDIPLFIRQIATDTEAAAASTIWNANIFGGICAASARPKRSAKALACARRRRASRWRSVACNGSRPTP